MEGKVRTRRRKLPHTRLAWATKRFNEGFCDGTRDCMFPRSLRRVRPDFLHRMEDITNIDHLKPQPDLVSPALKDPFSTSLHYLSQNLRRLDLRLVADVPLFWPDNNCAPSWLSLETFIVMFQMVGPTGRWYFCGPKDEGRDIATLQVTENSYPPLGTTDHDERMCCVSRLRTTAIAVIERTRTNSFA